jgi:hypothetical protein
MGVLLTLIYHGLPAEVLRLVRNSARCAGTPFPIPGNLSGLFGGVIVISGGSIRGFTTATPEELFGG